MLFFFGLSAFAVSRRMRAWGRAAYAVSVVLGSILVLIGVLWLLLSIAAYRGEG
jgi:hypothetical protein